MSKSQSQQPPAPGAAPQTNSWTGGTQNFQDSLPGGPALMATGANPQMSTSFADSGGNPGALYQNTVAGGTGGNVPAFTDFAHGGSVAGQAAGLGGTPQMSTPFGQSGQTPTQQPAPPGYHYDANGTLLLGGGPLAPAPGAAPQAPNANPGTGANGMPNFGPTAGPVQPGGIQSALGPAGAIQGSAQGGGPIQNTLGTGLPIQGALGPAGAIQQQVAMPDMPGYATQASYGSIQNALDRSNLPALVSGDALRGMTDDARNAALAVQQGYLDPQWNDRMAALESKLAQQGVMQNSEAWNRAMSQASREREFDYSQARNAAFGQGLQAQNQLYSQGLASRQNMFGEELSSGQFANAAQAQGFGQSMANAQLQNQARAAAVQDAMNAMALRNSAQGQQFQQGLAGAQFGNQAAAQDFAQRLGAGQFGNAAAQQQLDSNLALGQFANQSQNQAFGQNLAGAQYGLAAQGQQFGQGMANAQMQNALQNQLAQQWLQNQGYLTSTRNAQIGADASVAAANAGAAASTNNVQAQINAAREQNAFNNSMAYQQMLYNQGLGLGNYYGNMINGMYGAPGQNGGVIAPNFTNTPGAQVGGTDVGGIYNMGYQGQLNNYNAAMGGYNSQMNGLFGLGSAALGLFSDRRLKRNVRQIGVHENGLPVYAFDYVWGESAIGVMADEVERVRPDLVAVNDEGYKMVNYAGL